MPKTFHLARECVTSEIPPMAQLQVHMNGQRRDIPTYLDGDERLAREEAAGYWDRATEPGLISLTPG